MGHPDPHALSARAERDGPAPLARMPFDPASSPLLPPDQPIPRALPGGPSPALPDPPQAPAGLREPQDAAQPPAVDDTLLRHATGANPLLGAAMPLLTLVCQLRGTLRNDDVPRLQWMVSEELKAFESRALLGEASPQDVVAARYVLCSLLDETVLSTPWGGQSRWAAQSMLSVFHKETWGGEKVFVILDRVKAKPARYLHLIELLDTVLALGFRGRYGVGDNGLYQLEDLRAEVWRLIRAQRGVKEAPLSPEAKVERRRRALVSYVPLWVVFAAVGALLLVAFGGFQFALLQSVDGAAAALDGVAAGRQAAEAR